MGIHNMRGGRGSGNYAPKMEDFPLRWNIFGVTWWAAAFSFMWLWVVVLFFVWWPSAVIVAALITAWMLRLYFHTPITTDYRRRHR